MTFLLAIPRKEPGPPSFFALPQLTSLHAIQGRVPVDSVAFDLLCVVARSIDVELAGFMRSHAALSDRALENQIVRLNCLTSSQMLGFGPKSFWSLSCPWGI